MGLFDFFKKKEESKPIEENVYKKHVITNLLLAPQTCFYVQRLENSPKCASFFFKDSKVNIVEDGGMESAPFIWLLSKHSNNEDFMRIFEIIDKEVLDVWMGSMTLDTKTLMDDIKYYFPNFSLGNNPESVKTNLQWTWIDLKAMNKFISTAVKYMNANYPWDKNNISSGKAIKECDNMNDLVIAFMHDFANGNFKI